MRTVRILPALLALVLALAAPPAALGQGTRATGLVSQSYSPGLRVALTFDDGPWPISTSQILAILKSQHVRATFFLVGYAIQKYGQYLHQEVAQGMELGNHTFDHVPLSTQTTPAIVAQLASNQAEIRAKTGVTPHWFRPPYAPTTVDTRVEGVAASMGLRTAFWSVDSQDSASIPNANTIYTTVTQDVFPGAIVIMHDGGGDRSQTVQALPHIIYTLRQEGYSFVTMDQLFGMQSKG